MARAMRIRPPLLTCQEHLSRMTGSINISKSQISSLNTELWSTLPSPSVLASSLTVSVVLAAQSAWLCKGPRYPYMSLAGPLQEREPPICLLLGSSFQGVLG